MLYLGCPGSATLEVTFGLIVDKEPAVQNQTQNSPGRRTSLGGGDEAGGGAAGGEDHQIGPVGLIDLGEALESLPGARGSHGRVASRERLGFTQEKITFPGEWTAVGRGAVEALSRGTVVACQPRGAMMKRAGATWETV